MEQLSSGEKQILLILTTVFLQEEKPNVLLMDEPEISLHIGWQDKLIEKLRLLNPQCQLILTTHSPNDKLLWYVVLVVIPLMLGKLLGEILRKIIGIQ